MHHWISDPADLTARLARRPARVGLDTEFIRERTYWPQLALVQIAIEDDILLVDPLVPGMRAAANQCSGDQPGRACARSRSMRASRRAISCCIAAMDCVSAARSTSSVGSGSMSWSKSAPFKVDTPLVAGFAALPARGGDARRPAH